MKRFFFFCFILVGIKCFSNKDTLVKWRLGINLQNNTMFFRNMKPFLRFHYSPEFSLGVILQKQRLKRRFSVFLNEGIFAYTLEAPDLDIQNLEKGLSSYSSSNYPAHTPMNLMGINYLFTEAGFTFDYRIKENYFLGWGISCARYELLNKWGVKGYPTFGGGTYTGNVPHHSYGILRTYIFEPRLFLIYLMVNNSWKLSPQTDIGLNLKLNVIGYIFRLNKDEFPTLYGQDCRIDPFSYNLGSVELKFCWYPSFKR